MVEPTIDKLLTKADSKYSLVCAAAKRAREIANLAAENGEKLEAKPVGMAVQQIYDEGIAAKAAEAEAETAEEAEVAAADAE